MEPIEVIDERLHAILDSENRLEQVCSGAVWSEGPVWIPAQQALLWSDIPNNRILRWQAGEGMSVWRHPANFTNGHYLDLEGRLLHCSHGDRAILRTDLATLQTEVLVDRYRGKRLNSPNDLVVKSDGSIWFTDPPYGILSNREGYQAEPEQPANYVFRYDPATDTLNAVTDLLEEPNGLAFSPDESQLYVADTSAALRRDGGGNHHILVFDVTDGRHLENGRLFAEVSPGLADGFRLDRQGWVYTSSEDSIQVYHPDRTLLGKIRVPEKVSNCTFGGAQNNMLFITASTSIYCIRLNTQGLRP